MSPKSFSEKLQENMSKPSFCKSLSLGENWKSKSMRIIPEEFVRSTFGAFEHRVVFSDRWGSSWQLWLERDKKGLFMIEEDWDEFVDDNLLGVNDTLFFKHEDTMFFQVRIFDKDGKEIISDSEPHNVEPESELLHHKPHEKTTAFAFDSASPFASGSGSANGGTNGRAAKSGFGHVKNPERYLLNPESPYMAKTLTKKNDVLYVSRPVVQMYGLEFGPINSTIDFIVQNGREDAFVKNYGGTYCLGGWARVCREHNLKTGDSVVCEFERVGNLVTAVRLHFVNE